jgi:hypothetical protein
VLSVSCEPGTNLLPLWRLEGMVAGPQLVFGVRGRLEHRRRPAAAPRYRQNRAAAALDRGPAAPAGAIGVSVTSQSHGAQGPAQKGW